MLFIKKTNMFLFVIAVFFVVISGCAQNPSAPLSVANRDSIPDKFEHLAKLSKPMMSTQAINTIYVREGEHYNSFSGSDIYIDYKPSASNYATIHMGNHAGDTVQYLVDFPATYKNVVLEVRYSDDVAGNYIDVYLDGKCMGKIVTEDTSVNINGGAGWDVFTWASPKIFLGDITAGQHEIKFVSVNGGSWGMNLDKFVLTQMPDASIPIPGGGLSGTINLLSGVENVSQIQGISFVNTIQNQKAVLKINLDPSRGYSRVKFEITYGANINGWTFHIGDSRTNDGWGGDASSQYHDAEFHIVHNNGDIYASDYKAIQNPLLKHWDFHMRNMISPYATKIIEVANMQFAWDGVLYQSPYLFALDGQSDPGGSNYDIFVGLNRTIANSSRNGTGLQQVTITLLP